MEPAVVSPFAAWESFYVIIGSSAAALTGLQFVVIALGAEARIAGVPEVNAFGTPTVVHFCAVLLVSATLSMPWHLVSNAGLVLSTCGAAGLAYMLIVIKRMRRQQGYAPVGEDWLWHVVLPLIAYAVLLGAALLGLDLPRCLFVIAATALLLLFVGIHNAWDAVTYIAVDRVQQAKDLPAPQTGPSRSP